MTNKHAVLPFTAVYCDDDTGMSKKDKFIISNSRLLWFIQSAAMERSSPFVSSSSSSSSSKWSTT